jgi:hypothetical protein
MGEAKLVVKGKVVFEFLESPDGSWFSKVTPVMLPAADIRDTYKLALIIAVLQDTCRKKLEVVDRLIKEKAILEEMEKEDSKPVADVDRLQRKLPFEEDKDG